MLLPKRKVGELGPTNIQAGYIIGGTAVAAEAYAAAAVMSGPDGDDKFRAATNLDARRLAAEKARISLHSTAATLKNNFVG